MNDHGRPCNHHKDLLHAIMAAILHRLYGDINFHLVPLLSWLLSQMSVKRECDQKSNNRATAHNSALHIYWQSTNKKILVALEEESRTEEIIEIVQVHQEIF